MPMDQLYPGHIKALRIAQLIKPNFKFLTLKEQVANLKSQQSNNSNQEPSQEATSKQEKKKRDSSITTFFCIGYSQIWGKPIHQRLEALRKNTEFPFYELECPTTSSRI